MYRIACAGDNCVDYYDQTEEYYFGGNPVNVAVYLSELGAESSYIGAVGTDDYGRAMLERLRGKGVDVRRAQVREGKTALTHVRLQDGERILGDYDEGVMANFSLSAEDISFVSGHDLFVSGLWGHLEHDLEKIQAAGLPVAFDFADRPDDPIARVALRHSDIAFFSDDEAEEGALKARLRQLADSGPTLVVATRGARGSLAYDGERFRNYGIIPCEVVDSMGAGDSYIAGFLLAWLQKKSIRVCMESGTRKSAETLAHKGAWRV